MRLFNLYLFHSIFLFFLVLVASVQCGAMNYKMQQKINQELQDYQETVLQTGDQGTAKLRIFNLVKRLRDCGETEALSYLQRCYVGHVNRIKGPKRGEVIRGVLEVADMFKDGTPDQMMMSVEYLKSMVFLTRDPVVRCEAARRLLYVMQKLRELGTYDALRGAIIAGRWADDLTAWPNIYPPLNHDPQPEVAGTAATSSCGSWLGVCSEIRQDIARELIEIALKLYTNTLATNVSLLAGAEGSPPYAS
jgi:hypothetical protein